MKELTIEELKQMPGQPVWCPEEEAYGIVMCDKIGQWAGIPFLHGVWYSDDDGVGVEFNHNIIGRKLKCFRVEDKKEIAMPPQNKEIGFGDQTMACPNCGQSAIVNPFRKDREIYPYCPWCGQKLKEAEDEQTKLRTEETAGKRCYWSTGMCPSVEICDETRVGEAIATAIGLITVLAMIAMVPIIVIGGAIMLIWSIFAG